MIYDKCTLSGGSKAGQSVIFDKEGYVEVNSESAQYTMSITMNDEHPTDWFGIQIKGDGADTASLRQVDLGRVISADKLENVEVWANNKYDSAYTKFTTTYPSALIYQIDEETIGISADADGDGTYETPIETITDTEGEQDTDTDKMPEPDTDTEDKKNTDTDSEDKTDTDTDNNISYGDIDNDGNITANYALKILRSSVGTESFMPAQKVIADVDFDGEITANDALSVLRISVGL